MGKKSEYGSGNLAFIEYTEYIAVDPAYDGMPDVRGVAGTIQWEAPSNRTGGMFKDTHQNRLEWWRRKAVSIGLNPSAGGSWISRVAKTIHPTKMKPCKRCGRIMTIRYAYPSLNLLKRISKLPYVDESFTLDTNEHIAELITRMLDRFGEQVFASLPKLLVTPGRVIPKLPARLDDWLAWLDAEYIPSEPSLLGPGAMSNAPDRFDGFHSFNRCCRGTADPGRHKLNMQSYATDRRAFEYWVDGDWVAANRLMGLVRSDGALRQEACFNGHPGPCSADHIGPISLGFAHRPEFLLLCTACNSSKNNRMYAHDVEHLIRVEAAGEKVASWYSQALWDARKGSVDSNEMALRLSKVLRDNRHTVMDLLYRIEQAGHYVFLTSRLELSRADHSPTFENLRAGGHITRYDSITQVSRENTYVLEQKARRLRVAFEALEDYHSKPTRNSFIISTPEIEQSVQEALDMLAASPQEVLDMNLELRAALSVEVPSEETLRQIASRLPAVLALGAGFPAVQAKLNEAMALVAQRLSDMWTEDRYVRAVADDLLADDDLEVAASTAGDE
jgi:Alw26I/Eco31I/Esp3I family type II restriction endonuclease